jgi:hypothetical protein
LYSQKRPSGFPDALAEREGNAKYLQLITREHFVDVIVLSYFLGIANSALNTKGMVMNI